MNKQRFYSMAFVLGAAALVSCNAFAAGEGPWPVEVPAAISFGDTENYGTGPRRPDVPATVGFGDPDEQDGPVVLASAAIVDSQTLELHRRMVAEERERAAAALAHSGQAAAEGMY